MTVIRQRRAAQGITGYDQYIAGEGQPPHQADARAGRSEVNRRLVRHVQHYVVGIRYHVDVVIQGIGGVDEGDRRRTVGVNPYRGIRFHQVRRHGAGVRVVDVDRDELIRHGVAGRTEYAVDGSAPLNAGEAGDVNSVDPVFPGGEAEERNDVAWQVRRNDDAVIVRQYEAVAQAVNGGVHQNDRRAGVVEAEFHLVTREAGGRDGTRRQRATVRYAQRIRKLEAVVRVNDVRRGIPDVYAQRSRVRYSQQVVVSGRQATDRYVGVLTYADDYAGGIEHHVRVTGGTVAGRRYTEVIIAVHGAEESVGVDVARDESATHGVVVRHRDEIIADRVAAVGQGQDEQGEPGAHRQIPRVVDGVDPDFLERAGTQVDGVAVQYVQNDRVVRRRSHYVGVGRIVKAARGRELNEPVVGVTCAEVDRIQSVAGNGAPLHFRDVQRDGRITQFEAARRQLGRTHGFDGGEAQVTRPRQPVDLVGATNGIAEIKAGTGHESDDEVHLRDQVTVVGGAGRRGERQQVRRRVSRTDVDHVRTVRQADAAAVGYLPNDGDEVVRKSRATGSEIVGGNDRIPGDQAQATRVTQSPHAALASTGALEVGLAGGGRIQYHVVGVRDDVHEIQWAGAAADEIDDVGHAVSRAGNRPVAPVG